MNSYLIMGISTRFHRRHMLQKNVNLLTNLFLQHFGSSKRTETAVMPQPLCPGTAPATTANSRLSAINDPRCHTAISHPKEAAAILNRSVSAVSRATGMVGWEYADPKNRLLHRPGLEMRFRRKTRPRIDKPQRKTPGPPGRVYLARRRQSQSRRLIGNVDQRLRCWKVPCVLAPRAESPPVDAVLPNDR